MSVTDGSEASAETSFWSVDVDEADDEQLASLAQRQARADERIEDGEEDERDGERLEQRDDDQSQLAQLFVAQAAQIGFLTEDDSE